MQTARLSLPPEEEPESLEEVLASAAGALASAAVLPPPEDPPQAARLRAVRTEAARTLIRRIVRTLDIHQPL
ncbi:hypothetical protein C1I98_05395 [Spongiactinospora gelatinilytica]|uniref:Uncharacterized protein n=1 Tax=Spongiactinospora gelatinilytica TaxID=2666298 RepID=A0A2W2H0L3_9ACTN|nr:hypothetical protein C1I98_05395 [Spongiactinospora gelatinilytica]